MRTPTCQACCYYVRMTSPEARDDMGECRINPPVKMPSKYVEDGWPAVFGASDWCARWERLDAPGKRELQ